MVKAKVPAAPGEAAIGELIPAVAYYRMSSDRQEKSIPQQRKAVIAWAKRRGYRIVHEYQDEGVSGSAAERRPQFRAMIADVAGGSFRAILVWDQKRFGRFDVIEAGQWIKPIKDHDVRIVLVASDREVDLNTREGRLMFTFDTEAGRDYLESLSQQQLRARIELAKEGKPIGGPLPYGFDRLLTDEQGGHHRIRREQKFSKPRGWRAELVPNEDGEVATVRWIFEQFAEGRLTPFAIARELNRREVTPPGKWVKVGTEKAFKREAWRAETIRQMLRCPLYVGDAVRGRRTCGKFNRLVNQRIEPVKGRPKSEYHSQGLIVVPNAHPALIDRDVWNRTQERIRRTKRHSSPGRRGPQDASRYALTHFMFCGRCGSPMYGKLHRRGVTFPYVTYACPNASRKPGGRCGHWSIREDVILPYLLAELRRQFEYDDDRLAALVPSKPRREPSADVAPLERKLAEFNRKIDRGREQWLAGCPPDLAAGLESKLREWQAERDELEAKIRRATVPAPATAETDEWNVLFEDVRACIARRLDRRTIRVGYETKHGRPDDPLSDDFAIKAIEWDTAKLRDVFRRLKTRVDVYFEAKPQKTTKRGRPDSRLRWELVKGVYRIGGESGRVETDGLVSQNEQHA